jgi:hypothetical protein
LIGESPQKGYRNDNKEHLQLPGSPRNNSVNSRVNAPPEDNQRGKENAVTGLDPGHYFQAKIRIIVRTLQTSGATSVIQIAAFRPSWHQFAARETIAKSTAGGRRADATATRESPILNSAASPRSASLQQPDRLGKRPENPINVHGAVNRKYSQFFFATPDIRARQIFP